MSPDTPTTPRQRRTAFAVLLAGVVCMGMGQTIVFAVLPPLARRIGLHDMQVLSIFMLSALCWVLTGPMWGRRSDLSSRRRYIMLGLSGFAFSTILFATTIQAGLDAVLTGGSLYILLISTRIIYGILGPATRAAGQAYIADRTPPTERTRGMAGFSAAFGIGAMIGPAFGGVVGAISPIAPLYAVAALAAGSVILVYFFLPEKTAPKERASSTRLSPFDPRIRAFLIYGSATAISMAIPVQFIGFYLIDRLGLNDAQALQFVGIALSASALASLFSQIVLVQRFRFSPALLMRTGPLLVFLGHSIIAFSAHIEPIVFGMLVAGAGAGMIMPGFVGGASLSVTSAEQGAVAGLSNSASASSFVVAPILGYAAYSIAPPALFSLTALICLAAAIYAFRSHEINSAYDRQAQ